MPLVYWVEAVLLDREQVCVALRTQRLNCSLVNFWEARELAIDWSDNRHRRVGHLLQLADVDILLIPFPLRRALRRDFLSVYNRNKGMVK